MEILLVLLFAIVFAAGGLANLFLICMQCIASAWTRWCNRDERK